MTRDQAWRLRERRVEHPGRDEGGRAIVIGSGKGGVGKSVLSVLIAGVLARRGQRVLLVDAAMHLGHLHLLLGVCPALRTHAVITDGVDPERLMVEVGDGLWLLPADPGAEEVYRLSVMDRARLQLRLSELYDGFDQIVVDASPGVDGVLRVGAVGAGSLVVVSVPEPASISDAYGLIKIATSQLPRLPVRVIANRVSDDAEGAQVFARLELATRRFLRRELDYLGVVPERGSWAARVRRPGALLEERDPAVETLVDRLTTVTPAGAAVAEDAS